MDQGGYVFLGDLAILVMVTCGLSLVAPKRSIPWLFMLAVVVAGVGTYAGMGWFVYFTD